MYDDCPCGYPTVETKIENQTDLMKLYSLNEYQKSFIARVTFKVELISTSKINVNYCIPSDVALIMNFDLNSFNEEINKALLGKSADYITTHLIVMQIITETFNSHLIGICLDKDVENLMIKQIEIKHRMEVCYERRKQKNT
jgi:hypothetical protein